MANIALDWDKTANEDLALWSMFVRMATDRGWNCYVVTMRSEDEVIENMPELMEDSIIAVIYTGRLAKAKFAKDNYNLDFDIWIEDSPKKIFEDYSDSDGSLY